MQRVLEPEVMDTEQDARDYDAMDHSGVNERFVRDFLALHRGPWPVLDVGTGTALIPIELCQLQPAASVLAIDAAAEMLRRAAKNIRAAALDAAIHLQRADAKRLPYRDATFPAVMSNSLLHHVADPLTPLAEMCRVTQPGGLLFLRDLIRPENDFELKRLVNRYASNCNEHQRRLFADSLRASLTLDEVRELAAQLGLPPDCVQRSSDRHWTLACSWPG